MLLNGCILLARSEQAVYRGACQLLPLGCCSMWKLERIGLWCLPHLVLRLCSSVFALWWSSVKCSSATGGRHINTHTGGEEGRRTHTLNGPKLATHISVSTCLTRPAFSPQFSSRYAKRCLSINYWMDEWMSELKLAHNSTRVHLHVKKLLLYC